MGVDDPAVGEASPAPSARRGRGRYDDDKAGDAGRDPSRFRGTYEDDKVIVGVTVLDMTAGIS